MKIHVRKHNDNMYEVMRTDAEADAAQRKLCRGDQLERVLRDKGCTDAGVSNLLSQLKTANEAEIDL